MSDIPKGPPSGPKIDRETDEAIEDSSDEVLVRRIDRRLERQGQGDWPWLRRIVGFAMILAAFYYGWKMMDEKSRILVEQAKKKKSAYVEIENPLNSEAHAPLAVASSGPSSGSSSRPAEIVPSKPSTPVAVLSVALKPETLQTISDCTKGVSAFRGLGLNPKEAAAGHATLESVFQPVMREELGATKKTTLLQNIRIQTKSGEELRLHAAPKTQNGVLIMSLFRVAKDGLPEAIPFPPEIKDFEGRKIDGNSIARFLELSATPGEALEIERHEAWSFRDKASSAPPGLQVILSQNQIYDLQAFMPNKFLACSRSDRAKEPSVLCKCVERNGSP